jgi:hypothetical protein
MMAKSGIFVTTVSVDLYYKKFTVVIFSQRSLLWGPNLLVELLVLPQPLD